LNTHCDIVVGRDRELRLIGGNVFNGVTMRKLKLDVQGRAVLPRPVSMTYEDGDSGSYSSTCSPSNEAACDFNRQNWAVLLKLKPTAALPVQATGIPAPRPVTPQVVVPQPATLQPVAPQPIVPATTPSQPVMPAPSVPQPQTQPQTQPTPPPPVAPQPAPAPPPATTPPPPPPVSPR
jgi:hypothetical protein